MDDQEAVRVLHGGAGLAEQLKALIQPEVVRGAILVDGPRVADVLHDEIGLAIIGDSAVEQAADVGMFEIGQNSTLILEAAERSGRRHGRGGAV